MPRFIILSCFFEDRLCRMLQDAEDDAVLCGCPGPKRSPSHLYEESDLTDSEYSNEQVLWITRVLICRTLKCWRNKQECQQWCFLVNAEARPLAGWLLQSLKLLSFFMVLCGSNVRNIQKWHPNVGCTLSFNMHKEKFRIVCFVCSFQFSVCQLVCS